jgi:hypothetical protein
MKKILYLFQNQDGSQLSVTVSNEICQAFKKILFNFFVIRKMNNLDSNSETLKCFGTLYRLIPTSVH